MATDEEETAALVEEGKAFAGNANVDAVGNPQGVPGDEVEYVTQQWVAQG